MSDIYAIRNTINPFVYIGKTNLSIEKRYLEHLGNLRKNRHTSFILQRDFNEFGEKCFYVELVEHVEKEKNVLEIELYWIDKFASKSMCYNVNTKNFKGSYKRSWLNNIMLRAFFCVESE